jgi:hypothetical protein
LAHHVRADAVLGGVFGGRQAAAKRLLDEAADLARRRELAAWARSDRYPAFLPDVRGRASTRITRLVRFVRRGWTSCAAACSLRLTDDSGPPRQPVGRLVGSGYRLGPPPGAGRGNVMGVYFVQRLVSTVRCCSW